MGHTAVPGKRWVRIVALVHKIRPHASPSFCEGIKIYIAAEGKNSAGSSPGPHIKPRRPCFCMASRGRLAMRMPSKEYSSGTRQGPDLATWKNNVPTNRIPRFKAQLIEKKHTIVATRYACMKLHSRPSRRSCSRRTWRSGERSGSPRSLRHEASIQPKTKRAGGMSRTSG